MSTLLLERYDEALHTGQIVVDSEHRTSADYLIAAAWAQASDRRNIAALALFRLHEKLSDEGVAVIRSWAIQAMCREYARGKSPLRPTAAREIFEIVLHWKLEGVCPRCDGRKFQLVPGTQVISGHACDLCLGAGREPVQHRLPKRHHDAGRWLADQLDSMLTYAASEMARRLR